MTIVLADLGGTHLRLAKAGSADAPEKYKIADYPDIDSVLRAFAPDISALYLAAAIQPRGGVMEDKRFGDKSHWTIDLPKLQDSFHLQKLLVLNDLEAAAHALPSLAGVDLETLVPAREEQIHFDHPPKLLVGIGTGIGHAFLFEKAGHVPFVQRSHGGHMPAFGVSEEQKNILADMAVPPSRELIVEDVVSGTGFAALRAMTDDKTALRLFWEFLGLYCNMLVGASGAYGGIYLTGGVMDELIAAGEADARAFAENFHRRMVPVVVETLAACPVYYCRERNMAIRGLAALSGV